MNGSVLTQRNIERSASDVTSEDTTTGRKSDPVSVGSIALALLPSDLPFEGSRESLHEFLETLSKEKQQ